jgi:hypothetical protein
LQGAEGKLIVLNDDDPCHVNALLRWIYHDDYEEDSCKHAGPGHDIVAFHAGVEELADKYNLPELASKARERIESFLEQGWLWKLDIQNEVDAVFGLERNTPAYEYAETAIVKWCSENRSTVNSSVDDDRLASMLEENPRFALKLTRKLLGIKE